MPRRVSLVISALALVAIGAGTFLLVRAGSDPSGGGPEVSMEPTAFRPQTLTIRSGETVTFLNTSDSDKWPASDVHPTHERLPGFDAGRAVLAGESWSYRFTRRGRWTYHDHLSPEIKATIVVR
jgi:plastocyanin